MNKFFKLILKLVVVIIIILIGLGIYATFVERHLLTVKHKNIEVSENNTQSIKVVQFTDTHIGEFFSLKQLERTVKKINAQAPDLVIFSGDLFDIASQSKDRDRFFSVLGEIDATMGKYAIFGNRDYGGGAVRFYEASMEDADFTVLTDESERLKVGDKYLTIYGADDYSLGNPDVDILMDKINADDLNFLIVHEPDAFNEYINYPIDVAFTGHSHGGQVLIPFYGSIITTAFCEDYFKGLYSVDNPRKTQVFVSSGIGNTKYPFRFGNIPEIVSFDISF